MIVCFDIGGTAIKGALAMSPEDIRPFPRKPTPIHDFDAFVATLASVIAEAESVAGERPACIAISIAGVIDPDTANAVVANIPCIHGRPLQADLATALGLPVIIANDADCFVLAEAGIGAARGHRVVFGVILGTGVGGGLVIDGQIVEGRNRVAGEWGHNPLPWPGPDEIDGPLCYCGQSGCIETWISGPGFAADFERRNGLALSPEEIVAQAQAGDASAGAAIETLAERLGKALALVVNILDPDVIVLAGGVSNIPALYALAPKALARHAFSDAVTTPIRKAAHGDASGVRGAAWLWPEA